jgi:hypothetical protein
LKCLNYGFLGKYISNKGFITPLNKNNVSARGMNDYKEKYDLVIKDFVKPILESESK